MIVRRCGDERCVMVMGDLWSRSNEKKMRAVNSFLVENVWYVGISTEISAVLVWFLLRKGNFRTRVFSFRPRGFSFFSSQKFRSNKSG